MGNSKAAGVDRVGSCKAWVLRGLSQYPSSLGERWDLWIREGCNT